jgi:hypothetical protein
MTFDETSESLVILNAPPSLEEALVDWLLAHGRGTGFTSFPAEGHSTRHDNLSTAEQVSGRQRRQQFQVQMASAAVDEFLNALQASLGGAGIHYWVLPVSRSGRFGPDSTGVTV